MSARRLKLPYTIDTLRDIVLQRPGVGLKSDPTSRLITWYTRLINDGEGETSDGTMFVADGGMGFELLNVIACEIDARIPSR